MYREKKKHPEDTTELLMSEYQRRGCQRRGGHIYPHLLFLLCHTAVNEVHLLGDSIHWPHNGGMSEGVLLS